MTKNIFTPIAIATALAISGTAWSADVINQNKTVNEWSSVYFFGYGTSKFEGNTITNTDAGSIVQANSSATVNLTGGNNLTGEGTTVFANSTSTVNISGKNTFTMQGGKQGAVIFANSNSTINISGENTISTDQVQATLIQQNSSSTVNIGGKNTFTNSGAQGYGVFSASGTVNVSGENTFDMAGTAFHMNTSSGKLNFEEGSKTTVKASNSGINSFGAIHVAENASLNIEQSKYEGIHLNNSSKMTIEGDVSVNSSYGALVTNYTSTAGTAVEVKGGSLTLNAVGENAHAIKSYNSQEKAEIQVNGAGSLNVKGDVSGYLGNYAIQEKSTGTFTDLTLNGKMTVADSTLTADTVTNEKGAFTFNNSQITVNGTPDGTSNLGSVNSTGSTLNLGAGKYTIGALTGGATTISLAETSKDKVSISSLAEGTAVTVAGAGNTDDYGSPKAYAQALTESIALNGSEKSGATSVYTPESSLFGETTSQIVDGNLVFNDSAVQPSAQLQGLNSVNSIAALTWRHEMNSLNKRMGELRDSPAGVGTWVRLYGSEMEYGKQSVLNKNNTIQVGGDYSLGDWKVGAAFSYTDGESSYDEGTADNKAYGFALYGTWFVPCGAYVDLIAKYSRLDNDFTLGNLNGSYDNNAYSASAEVGYRFEFLDGGLFLEPQVELSFGRISGDTFDAGDGVKVEQDDYDSLIGRIGVRTGFVFPNNAGRVYARVSGVRDFKGETSATAVKGNGRINVEDDLGGNWVEYGVGANFNLTDTSYAYVDLERTSGGEATENWRWNIGFRHVW